MNVEKLKRLQSQVRIGGKGTPRRKKKVMHQTAAADDKKLQSSLKKLSVSTIPGIEEVNIIKDDLTVIHFNNPKAQASLSANTFAVTGHGETKKVVEMLPEILPQLGQDTVAQLRMFASSMSNNQSKVSGDKFASNLLANIDEDDVPLLVNDFDEIAKKEDHSKGKKSDKKDDSQEANQAKSIPPGVKKPNENKGTTLLEASKTNTNLKSKGVEKNKNTSPPAKGEKKEVNAQKGGANPKNLNQASTQNQKEKTLKSSPENMKHESKSKSDNLNMAPAYDLKDILNSLPLSEVTGIDVDNYAYVDRSAINSSAVKNNISTSPCPVQDVCPKPNLSPIDNASNLKSVEAVKPKLSELQLTDLMMLEKSKNKEMKKSTNNLQQMVQTPNDKVGKKDVQKDDKKPKDTQLPSSPEVRAKSPLTSGNKPQVVQGMHTAIPVGAPVELGNKTEEVKDVKENSISAAVIQASAKKEQEEVQMKQFPPLPAAPALSLENKTIAIQEQQRMPKNILPQQVTPDNAPMQIVQNKPPPQKVAQNSPLQEAAQNTTRLVAATLGLENKENLQGVPGDSSQSNSSLGLARLPGDMKAVPQPDVAQLSSLVSIAPTVQLEPSKETIMQTKSVPKEQTKVETSSSTPGVDTKAFEGTTSVANESSSKEQIMPNRSDVAPKPQPTVSNKTAIQKTPQPKKGAISKDNGKQQVKSSSPTTPKAATDAAKKTDPSAKSKQMKPQVPTAQSQSTGAASKPQTTSKSPPANQAAKQEKPAVSPRGKTSMSGQTKQQGPATPKPATTQEKKSPAAPALSDPSSKAVATSVKSTPSTPEAKPGNNNLMKDKKANPQKIAAAESATKSASPPKATQPKVPEDQNKKSGQ